ncbi:MAG: hypothetical protein QM493_05800 [Sulfurovum sp.]
MKALEDKLEELDIYFSTKKEQEKWVMILGLAGLLAYMGYAFLLPYTEELHKQSEKSKKRIEKSIIDNRTYLKSISRRGNQDYMVIKLDRDIKNKKASIVKYKKKIEFIDLNLMKLSDMLFNQKSWSKFLNSITTKAEIQNVELQYITNHYVDSNGSFGHVLEIGIGCKGDYKNIIKFMNELEQNVLVTDIFKTELALDTNSSKIVADIHISVWGINH